MEKISDDEAKAKIEIWVTVPNNLKCNVDYDNDHRVTMTWKPGNMFKAYFGFQKWRLSYGEYWSNMDLWEETDRQGSAHTIQSLVLP